MSAIRWTFATPRAWAVWALALLGYAATYLLVAKAIVVDGSASFGRFGPLPLVVVAPDLALGHFFRWLDPIFVAYLTDSIVVSPSAPALVTAILLGGLVGLNAAVAVEAAVRRPPACARGGAWWLAAVVPSFLATFSCCAPTILLLVGGTFAGAVIAVTPYAVPLAAALLVVSLAWSVRRLERGTILSAAAAA